MRAKFVAASVASLAFGCSLMFAEWKLLSEPGNQTYEVGVDFQIKDLRIARNGDATFVAIGTKGDDEIGFAAKITKPEKFRAADQPLLGDQAASMFMLCTIDVTSIGAPTKKLEQLLNTELAHGRQVAESYRLAGPMRGICPLGFGHHISETAHYVTMDSGVAYDEGGKLLAASLFSVVFMIDAPMGRVTVYFSRPPNIGGVSVRSSGRFQWFEAQRKKANKAPEPTPGSVTPRAMEGVLK